MISCALAAIIGGRQLGRLRISTKDIEFHKRHRIIESIIESKDMEL